MGNIYYFGPIILRIYELRNSKSILWRSTAAGSRLAQSIPLMATYFFTHTGDNKFSHGNLRK
jgi:hypothetical protein